jgi:hypothetical protein
MNEPQVSQTEQPRILGRMVAKETTLAELELSLAAGKPTWSLSFPPDHD